jgi:putative acetyltransferase
VRDGVTGSREPDMNLRRYQPHDAEALAGVYRDSVLGLGWQGYSAEHLLAWASFVDDVEDFRIRLAKGFTWVAEVDEVPVAFGQLEPSDHVAFLYCVGEVARQGIATALYEKLEETARECDESLLHTEASRISRPFFEKMGFEVVAPEWVERAGLRFERFHMRKRLD